MNACPDREGLVNTEDKGAIQNQVHKPWCSSDIWKCDIHIINI